MYPLYQPSEGALVWAFMVVAGVAIASTLFALNLIPIKAAAILVAVTIAGGFVCEFIINWRHKP